MPAAVLVRVVGVYNCRVPRLIGVAKSQVRKRARQRSPSRARALSLALIRPTTNLHLALSATSSRLSPRRALFSTDHARSHHNGLPYKHSTVLSWAIRPQRLNLNTMCLSYRARGMGHTSSDEDAMLSQQAECIKRESVLLESGKTHFFLPTYRGKKRNLTIHFHNPSQLCKDSSH